MKLLTSVLVMGLIGAAAVADTVYMKNGVQIHGKVISRDEKAIRLQIGKRKTAIRTSEIIRVDKNDKTGKLDLEKTRLAALARDRKLTEETGLTGPQRAAVESALVLLGRADPNLQVDGLRKLIALAQEIDVFGYCEYSLPGMFPNYVPGVLQALATLDPLRALPQIHAQATSVHGPSRAMALALLGRLGDRESVPLMISGLVDHEWEVSVAAAGALGALGVKEATPVLIENLKAFDLRVQNANRGALERIWSVAGNEVRFAARSDWEAFWKSRRSSAGQPYDVRAIEPLVPAGVRFQDE